MRRALAAGRSAAAGARAALRHRAAAVRWLAAAPDPEQPQSRLEPPLSKEELQSRLDAEDRWSAFCKQLQEAREQGAAERLAALDGGIALGNEVGAELTPPGYRAAMRLERAQALWKLGRLEEALESAREAEAISAKGKDTANLWRAREIVGYVLNELGREEEGRALFQELLDWADGPAKMDVPMVQAAAAELVPTAQAGLAAALVRGKKFDQAHEVLGRCLPGFAEKKNYEATMQCLELAEECFRGLGDARGVRRALERQLTWAKRFDRFDRFEVAEKVQGKLDQCVPEE